MFANAYQAGPCVSVLAAQGRDPAKAWRLAGSIQRSFAKEVRGYVYNVEGGSGTKMMLPKDGRSALGLVQPFLVLQVFVPPGRPFSVELSLSDATRTRRRLILSTAFKDVAVTQLHAQVPLAPLRRGEWLTLALDLRDLFEANFPGSAFRALEMLSVGAVCKLRRVFTMRAAPAGGDYPQTEAVPRAEDFPAAVGAQVQVVSMAAVRRELDGAASPAAEELGEEGAAAAPVHIAFGSRAPEPQTPAGKRRAPRSARSSRGGSGAGSRGASPGVGVSRGASPGVGRSSRGASPGVGRSSRGPSRGQSPAAGPSPAAAAEAEAAISAAVAAAAAAASPAGGPSPARELPARRRQREREQEGYVPSCASSATPTKGRKGSARRPPRPSPAAAAPVDLDLDSSVESSSVDERQAEDEQQRQQRQQQSLSPNRQRILDEQRRLQRELERLEASYAAEFGNDDDLDASGSAVGSPTRDAAAGAAAAAADNPWHGGSGDPADVETQDVFEEEEFRRLATAGSPTRAARFTPLLASEDNGADEVEDELDDSVDDWPFSPALSARRGGAESPTTATAPPPQPPAGEPRMSAPSPRAARATMKELDAGSGSGSGSGSASEGEGGEGGEGGEAGEDEENRALQPPLQQQQQQQQQQPDDDGWSALLQGSPERLSRSGRRLLPKLDSPPVLASPLAPRSFGSRLFTPPVVPPSAMAPEDMGLSPAGGSGSSSTRQRLTGSTISRSSLTSAGFAASMSPARSRAASRAAVSAGPDADAAGLRAAIEEAAAAVEEAAAVAEGTPEHGEGEQGEGEGEREEELDLIYDPVLNCYYHPSSGRYYELK